MQVIGLVGSARRKGNTDVMVDAVLGGAERAGHRTSKVYLEGMEIGPCIDCRGCKQGARVCIVQDGMQRLYGDLDAADVIVFGTPVYWWGPSGTMKQVIDRLRPYYASKGLGGKRAILVAPAGDGPGEADLLTPQFERMCRALGIEVAGQAFGTAYDRGDILRDTEALARADSLGAGL